MDFDKHVARALRAAFPYTLPVMAGFVFLGIAYGLLMASKGYGPVWSLLMSALAFCGSMQFVAITLLTVAFNPIAAFLMSLMVNARHLFYGLSMLKKYRGMGKLKPFLIFWMCDETFSIAYSAEPPVGIDKRLFYFFISLLDYLYWVIASVLGGLLGGIITFNTKGLDFVLTALFVVIFLDQWRKSGNRRSAVIGVASTALCLALFGSSNFVVPSMALILLVLVALRGRLEKQEVERENCK